MREEYKLVFLTLLVRLGVGTLLVACIAAFWAPLADEWIVALSAFVVTGCGLLLSLLHVGRPARLMNTFANRRSMMSLEALLSPPLMLSIVVLAVLAYLWPEASWLVAPRLVVLVLGTAFIYVTGRVYRLRARPSWTTSLLLYEYFTSTVSFGLLGYATLLVALGEMTTTSTLVIGSVLMPLLGVEAVITYAFRARAMHATVTAAKALGSTGARRLYALFVVVGLLTPATLALVAALGATSAVVAPVALIAFLLGAMWWRVLFFRSATIIKLTPDIVI